MYVTDALYTISQNTSVVFGAKEQGPHMDKRYCEILNKKPEETKTPEEAKDHMMNKLRGGEKD